MLKRSSSNSSMPKCLPTWRNQLTRRFWRMAHTNRLCSILEGSWNWTVWKPQMKCKSTLWHNKPHNKTLKIPNQRATIAKSQVTIEISAVNSNEKKTKSKVTLIVLEITTITMVVPKQNPTPSIKFPAITTRTIQLIEDTENPDLSTHPVRPVVELTTPQRNVTLEQMQQKDRLPGIDNRNDKTKSNREMLKATQMGKSKLQPKLQNKYATSSFRSCAWQTGDKWNTKTFTNFRGCLAATQGDQ